MQTKEKATEMKGQEGAIKLHLRSLAPLLAPNSDGSWTPPPVAQILPHAETLPLVIADLEKSLVPAPEGKIKQILLTMTRVMSFGGDTGTAQTLKDEFLRHFGHIPLDIWRTGADSIKLSFDWFPTLKQMGDALVPTYERRKIALDRCKVLSDCLYRPNRDTRPFLAILAETMPALLINKWIEPLHIDVEGGRAVARAPSRFHADWVSNSYTKQLEHALGVPEVIVLRPGEAVPPVLTDAEREARATKVKAAFSVFKKAKEGEEI